MSDLAQVLARLSAVIESRKGGDPAASYTARLLAEPERAAKKLGEEAVETVIAAISGEHAALVAETSDLLYHLAVLLHARGVTIDEVEAELARRTHQSGLAEKAARG